MKKRNALREARRSQHLTRMSRRTESVATYHDTFNGRGELVESKYLGHVLKPLPRVFQGNLIDSQGKSSRFAPLSANIR